MAGLSVHVRRNMHLNHSAHDSVQRRDLELFFDECGKAGFRFAEEFFRLDYFFSADSLSNWFLASILILGCRGDTIFACQ